MRCGRWSRTEHAVVERSAIRCGGRKGSTWTEQASAGESSITAGTRTLEVGCANMELLRFIGFGGIAAFSAIGAFLVAGDERGGVRPGPA